MYEVDRVEEGRGNEGEVIGCGDEEEVGDLDEVRVMVV